MEYSSNFQGAVVSYEGATSTLVCGGSRCLGFALQGRIQTEVDRVGVIVEKVIFGIPGVIAV